jgi:hypothetical protein
MTGLTCPVCELRVPPKARDDAGELHECPRCLARTGGAVSVRLVQAPSASERARSRTAAVPVLRHLLSATARR